MGGVCSLIEMVFFKLFGRKDRCSSRVNLSNRV